MLELEMNESVQAVTFVDIDFEHREVDFRSGSIGFFGACGFRQSIQCQIAANVLNSLFTQVVGQDRPAPKQSQFV